MVLLPTDSYVVINKTIVTELDKKILIDLYQPIIGNKAVSFYLTLLNDLEKNSTISRNYNHYHLLNMMQISLIEVKEARERLEAVGLIRTYLKKDKINNFIYLLYSPLGPNDFFNHPIFSVVLYNNIGKVEYQKLINSYKIPRINLKDYTDISCLFNDVFETVPANSFILNKDIMMKNNNKLKFNNFFDMETLLSGLSDLPISFNALNDEVKDLIINLSCIYNLDVLTMQDIIKANIKETGMIDKEALRKSCRNYYQFENNGNLPTLVYAKNKVNKKEVIGSKKEMMINTFSNTHPYQFLKSKYKDGKVIDRDLNLLESLLVDLKLNPGVVNVLIDYVLKVNNQKLNKNYVETIASQWKRLGITTVEEAMDACKKEHKKMLKIKTRLNDSKKKEVKEVVPEWFNQNIEKKEVSKEEEEQLKKLLENYE